MAWRFVRQPNGKLARWSDIVDDFTHLNLSPGGAAAICLQQHGMGAAETGEKVGRAMRDERPDGSAGDGTFRWRECLDTMRELDKHGEAEACELEAR
jgi:hypothetical protein